jgi:hypothetical protein
MATIFLSHHREAHTQSSHFTDTQTLGVHRTFGFFVNWTGSQKGEESEYHLLVLAIVASLILQGGVFSLDRALTLSVHWVLVTKDIPGRSVLFSDRQSLPLRAYLASEDLGRVRPYLNVISCN